MKFQIFEQQVFLTDYDNYINKNLSFNCFNLSEIENNYRNYFMNGTNFLEKCGISCKNCNKKMIVKYAILITVKLPFSVDT